MSRTDEIAGTHLAPDPADLNRLLAGAHHNPHAILGAHEYGDHTVIRAFRPHASEVVALVGDDRFPLQHIESGLFAVAVPFVNLIDYRLQVSYEGSGSLTVADAYRFLPTLGEVDLHLFGEGRHERLWEVLGAHPRSFTTADGAVEGDSGAEFEPQRGDPPIGVGRLERTADDRHAQPDRAHDLARPRDAHEGVDDESGGVKQGEPHDEMDDGHRP